MTKKICQGCPDRFKGCVRLVDDQTLPHNSYPRQKYGQAQQDMLKVGWRKVEIIEEK